MTPAPELIQIAPAPAGERWSPTALNTLLQCQAKYFYRHVRREPESKSIALLVGSAVHEGAWHHLRSRGPAAEAVEHYWETLTTAAHEHINNAAALDGEEWHDASTNGAKLLELWIRDAAPLLDPVSIEERIEGELAGVPVAGVIDLRLRSGAIYDLKTSKTKPSGISGDQKNQAAIYAALDNAPGVIFETLVPTKGGQIVTHLIQGPELAAAIDHAEALLPIARDVAASGLYLPNRSSFACSRQFCAYWQACEADYGGQVKP